MDPYVLMNLVQGVDLFIKLIEIFTNCYVSGTVGLEKFIQVSPGEREPINDPGQLVQILATGSELGFNEPAFQIATEESLDWFEVISAEDPPEVVV